MSIPNVSTLYQRINKGSEGGSEFSRILNLLLLSESENENFKVTISSDASGDYKGVDSIMCRGINKTGVQYKFYPSPLSSNHKSSIKESLKKAIDNFQDMDEWLLVTPEDLQKADMLWLDTVSKELNIPVKVLGHTWIVSLMLKHAHLCKRYYPELSSSAIKLNGSPTSEDIDSYFSKFIDPDSDILILFLKAQPTLADCKAIFAAKYYKEVCDIYYLHYRSIVDDTFDRYYLKGKEEFELKSTSYSELKTRNHDLPGGMHMMIEKHNALNPNTKFYKVTFKEKEASAGVSFKIWCFIKGRWVFFPKPFGVIDSIEAMRNDKDLNFIIKLLKWFGLGKKLEKKYRNQSILAVNHILYKLFNKE